MDDVPGINVGARRNEEIALEMMKFIAMTTGYGKMGTVGTGFQGGAMNRADEYADHLLELYGRCLDAINRKR